MSVSLQIWTLTDCFPVYFKHFCRFAPKNITIKHIYSNFSTPNFSEEFEPMCVIHNISIATSDDVTYFGDDVKYIPCIFTRGNYH